MTDVLVNSAVYIRASFLRLVVAQRNVVLARPLHKSGYSLSSLENCSLYENSSGAVAKKANIRSGTSSRCSVIDGDSPSAKRINITDRARTV